MSTISFANGKTTHQLKNEQATRFGTRYNAACGAYGFHTLVTDSPVRCEKCKAATR